MKLQGTNYRMLWQDTAGTLAERIERAAKHYVDKYDGEQPEIAFVHPSNLPAGVDKIGDIRIQSDVQVSKACILIGVR